MVSKIATIGVDLGNDKITISKIQQDDQSPVVIADMMDIRNIPNRVMFLKEKDQLRKFGNNTVLNKSWNNSSLKLTQTSDLLVGDRLIEKVPGFIVKNMIIGHVKQIIDTRFPELHSSQKYVIVPSWNESSSNILFDTLGARTILMNENKEMNVETISEVDAMILNYVGKYVLSMNDEVIAPRTVLIIDIGHKKTNFVLFSMSKDKQGIVVKQLITLTMKEICGSVVDDILVEYMGKKAIEKYNYNPNGDLKFRAQCIRLKHQLSLNKKINFTFETPERDMTFEILRSEIEQEMKVVLMLLKKNIGIINETYGNPSTVELIGGSGRLPMFKSIIEEMYPNVQRTMNPDEAVSNGAAIYGQLLTNKNKNIMYSKIIYKNVDVQYIKDNERKIVRVFEKYQETNPMNSNTSVIRIAKSDNFQIIIDDLVIDCVLEESDIFGNAEEEYMDIELMYNMTDLVDVVSVKGTKSGINIPYQLYVDCHQLDISKLIENYGPVENMIKGMESHNEIMSSITNFIEEYYYDTESVNRMIKNINQIHGSQGVENIETVRNPDHILKSPLKEVCEFYDFCRLYTKVPDTDFEKQSYDYIVSVLNNPDGLNGMLGAIHRIKDVKSKYDK